MSIRYFLKPDADPIKIGTVTFKFEPAHRNISTGGVWGMLSVEDGPAARLLAKDGRKRGVSEITEEQAIVINQKKSQPNINLVQRQNTTNETPTVGRVEGNVPNETKAVDSVDELLSGPAPETPKAEPKPVVKEEPIPDTKIEDSPEPEVKPTPKKRGGRPRKNKG